MPFKNLTVETLENQRKRIAQLEEFVGRVAKADDPPSRSLDIRIKQLVELSKEAKELLKETLKRFESLCPPST